jgi:hypothetical protein
LRAFLALFVCLALTGCVTELFDLSGGFDGRAVTVQTADLFNQRAPSRLAKRSWKGDWILRRDRLEMVDTELRNSKPDLILLQDVMAKEGSGAESDYRILKAGALTDYEWRLSKVESYEDTQETQSMAIAVGIGLRFIPTAEGERETWVMGAGGYLAAATVEYEDQPLLVFDVQMPPHNDNDYLWYSFVQERIKERVARAKTCMKRVIVAGYLPGDEGARRYVEVLAELKLRDAALGFCQIPNKCFTATPANDLYLASVGDEAPTRTDKILFHQSALLYSSARNFEDSDPNSRYIREFGVNRLWPTQRFGWVANARLARCTAKEIADPFVVP